MESHTYGIGTEAHFEHDETLCDCPGSNLRSYQILSFDVTFEARPLCNLARCTALWKDDISMKIKIKSKSIKFCWVKYFVSLHSHTNLHL